MTQVSKSKTESIRFQDTWGGGYAKYEAVPSTANSSKQRPENKVT